MAFLPIYAYLVHPLLNKRDKGYGDRKGTISPLIVHAQVTTNSYIFNRINISIIHFFYLISTILPPYELHDRLFLYQ